MNTVITSRQEILKACRELVTEQGLENLNIRGVARRCGISVGAVYHYFPSKAELAAAAVEEVWRSLFHGEACAGDTGFSGAVERAFDSFRRGAERYPNFFSVHSMVFHGSEKDGAGQVMESAFSHMKAGLLAALRRDPAARGAFARGLSQEAFVELVFAGLLSLLARGEPTCASLLEVIRRTLQ